MHGHSRACAGPHTHTHTHTHTRMHARTHARTHAHVHMCLQMSYNGMLLPHLRESANEALKGMDRKPITDPMTLV